MFRVLQYIWEVVIECINNMIKANAGVSCCLFVLTFKVSLWWKSQFSCFSVFTIYTFLVDETVYQNFDEKFYYLGVISQLCTSAINRTGKCQGSGRSRTWCHPINPIPNKHGQFSSTLKFPCTTVRSIGWREQRERSLCAGSCGLNCDLLRIFLRNMSVFEIPAHTRALNLDMCWRYGRRHPPDPGQSLEGVVAR